MDIKENEAPQANEKQHVQKLKQCFNAWPHVNELYQDNEGTCYFTSELAASLGKKTKLYKRSELK